MIGLLHEYVTRQAEHRADATAAVLGDASLTYAELDSAANRLARTLMSLGLRRGDRVSLLVPKGLEALIGIMGTLKAGGIYVPIDPASPAPRAAKMIAACESPWLLMAGKGSELLRALSDEGALTGSEILGWLDDGGSSRGAAAAFSWSDVVEADPGPVQTRGTAEDPAYILFTSGSTGTPKGVMVSHRNVTHFIAWAVQYFGIDETDRVSAHPPLHFDLSVFDMFGAFAAGAELHLVREGLSLLAAKLTEFIRDSELTQWFSVPAVLNYLTKFDVIEQNAFPSLRRVIWCGEVLPTPTLRQWMTRIPHATFTNLYGPTETTIASSYYTVPECPVSDTDDIPIGVACDDEELLVLDDAMQTLPAEEIGELYIGGVGLGAGYWRDPEKTAAAFVADPRPGREGQRLYRTGDLAKVGRDGLVYFLGRTDSQIKSRGYRIELGEIETALHTFAYLKEVAVVAVPTQGFAGWTICCAYSVAEGETAGPIDLRSDLAGLLPTYMLPSQWLELERLPKNPNGKIDRPALKASFAVPERASATS